MSEDFIITASELKAAGFCYSGQFKWFRQQGLDLQAHLRSGTLASVLLATGDGLAVRAVGLIEARRHG